MKRFTIFDLKLAQAAAIFGAVIFVKLVPAVLEIDLWWFVVLGAVCVVRPAYTMFVKA